MNTSWRLFCFQILLLVTVFNNLRANEIVSSNDSNIPTVDMQKLRDGQTDEFDHDLDNALRAGFFAVRNSGIDHEKLRRAYEKSEKFFRLPQEEKNKISIPGEAGQRGYVPGESALDVGLKDTKEFVHIGRERNYWPELEGFQESIIDLHQEMDELTIPLLQSIARCLKQHDDYLLSKTQKGDCLLRLLHYMANPSNNLWAAKHTDIDLFTILPYASEKGLKVKTNNEWKFIRVEKNSLVFNVGDMLEILSNGEYPSCEHQVECTQPDTERFSIVYFIHPETTTELFPLPAFVTAEKPAAYPMGTHFEYLFLRLYSLKLLNKEQSKWVTEGGLIQRIKAMVEAKTAHDSVKRWYVGFQKTYALEK